MHQRNCSLSVGRDTVTANNWQQGSEEKFQSSLAELLDRRHLALELSIIRSPQLRPAALAIQRMNDQDNFSSRSVISPLLSPYQVASTLSLSSLGWGSTWRLHFSLQCSSITKFFMFPCVRQRFVPFYENALLRCVLAVPGVTHLLIDADRSGQTYGNIFDGGIKGFTEHDRQCVCVGFICMCLCIHIWMTLVCIRQQEGDRRHLVNLRDFKRNDV